MIGDAIDLDGGLSGFREHTLEAGDSHAVSPFCNWSAVFFDRVLNRQNFDEGDGFIAVSTPLYNAFAPEVLDSTALHFWQLVCLSLAE